MSELTEIVDSLENRISKLLHKYENLKQNQSSLEEEMTAVKEENLRLTQQLEGSNQQVQNLKAANAMLGSTEFKTETKLKLNSLIREIDQCIVQLSE
jgi:regulator of replication initiation timing